MKRNIYSRLCSLIQMEPNFANHDYVYRSTDNVSINSDESFMSGHWRRFFFSKRVYKITTDL